MMYIFHFAKMDIRLDIHNFFYKDHIQMFQGIYHSFLESNSNNLVIYKQCISYLRDEAYLQGRHIFLFEYYIQKKEDMKDIYLCLNSNDMVNCKKCIFLQKCKVR